MMGTVDYLGWLCWWTFDTGHTFTTRQMNQAIDRLDLAKLRPPVPIDVFRRLTMPRTSAGSNRALFSLYEEDGLRVTLEFFEALSTDKMLVRHIVRTARKGKLNVSVTRVGDVAFLLPPRGQHEKARLRVQVAPTADEHVKALADRLRRDYKHGLDHFDDQAARRLTRTYLTKVGAFMIEGGAYFMEDQQDAEHAVRIVEGLGGRVHLIPVVDDEPRRQMLARWRDANAKE